MKRNIKLLLILMISLMALICSCSEKYAEKIEAEDSSPLLICNGEVLLTAKDYNALVSEDILKAEFFGTDRKTTEELFTSACERELVFYYAGLYGAQTELGLALSEYDQYYSDLRTNLDNNTLKYIAALRKELGMTEDEYRSWAALQTQKQDSISQFFSQIGGTYADISDTADMQEVILDNLLQLSESSEIVCNFEGFTDYTPTFQYIIKA